MENFIFILIFFPLLALQNGRNFAENKSTMGIVLYLKNQCKIIQNYQNYENHRKKVTTEFM